jgi:hypothetical protein
MDKIRIHKLIAIIAVFCVTSSAYCQLSQLGILLASGQSDATKLLQQYLKPMGNSLGANLSAGWYNTAKVHKLLGFDLTFSLSFAMVPSGDKSFDPSKIGLSPFASVTPVGKMAPTLSGARSQGPTISYVVAGQTLASYSTPKGLGVGFVPSPMLQLTVGLIKETSLSFRYVPTTKIGSFGSIGLWGIGIQHGLKQWIPVVSRVPFLNLTFQAGYTKLSNSDNISIVPNDIGSLDQTSAPVTWSGQKMDLTVSNFTANILASIDIPVITVYGGVGISSSKTDVSLLGYYPIPSNYDIATSKGIVNNSNATTMKDPIKAHIGNNDGSLTKPRLSAGLKFKLGPIHIHGDYTYAYYSIVSAGIGISIR